MSSRKLVLSVFYTIKSKFNFKRIIFVSFFHKYFILICDTCFLFFVLWYICRHLCRITSYIFNNCLIFFLYFICGCVVCVCMYMYVCFRHIWVVVLLLKSTSYELLRITNNVKLFSIRSTLLGELLNIHQNEVPKIHSRILY